MDGKSKDIAAERLAQLKAIMPEAFSEGKIDWEKLKLTLGEDIQIADERYVLNWAGKSDAFRAIQTPTTATLAPQREESVNFDKTENIFIEGENLEVLKIMQKAYYGRIKMIYIDPPYNTGNDSFVYPDKFSESREEYLQRIQAKDADGAVVKEGLFHSNRKDSGHYHSNWLTMMYPRLFLARNLLREDGIIFISIDDNEVHNLRLMMNEIFGEENFVASVIWQKIHSIKNDAKYFSENHEYILIFAKNKEACQINLLPRTEEMNNRYQNPDNDPRGRWSSGDLVASEERTGGYYDIVGPNGDNFTVPKGKHWVYSKKNMEELIKDNRIWFGNNGDAFPRLKRFLSEVQQGRKASTLWLSEDVGHNQEARRETKKIFDGADLFDTPKPTRLLSQIITLSTNACDGDIILDFFAGSGTTAQAVLEKNCSDNGNRIFIVVQIDESTDYDEKPFVSSITHERILNSINNIKIANPLFHEINLGLRKYKYKTSNFKLWRGDGLEQETDIEQQLDLLEDPVMPDAQEENLLTELMLKSGYMLTAEVEKREIGKGHYFIVENETAFALSSLDAEMVADMLAMAPATVVCLDALFKDDDALKANTQLQFQDAGIRFESI